MMDMVHFLCEHRLSSLTTFEYYIKIIWFYLYHVVKNKYYDINAYMIYMLNFLCEHRLLEPAIFKYQG